YRFSAVPVRLHPLLTCLPELDDALLHEGGACFRGRRNVRFGEIQRRSRIATAVSRIATPEKKIAISEEDTATREADRHVGAEDRHTENRDRNDRQKHRHVLGGDRNGTAESCQKKLRLVASSTAAAFPVVLPAYTGYVQNRSV
ncbi:hypothetical protein, partial [Alkalicoccus urumqiensis]|uniref:hypothetical protein n=1 Tax=Alkalicoccus urumqiensis TaxID=1548213 RepID=UPI001AECBBC8